MNATLKVENGHAYIQCFYDPIKRDWNQAIADALALFGQSHPGTPVFCNPARTTSGNNNNSAPQLSLW